MKNRCRYTKSELAKDIGITSKRLTIELKTLEPELLERFPTYSRKKQILNPKIYKFILKELSDCEPEEIVKIMKLQRVIENFGE